jgi:hypothetical protein
VAKKKAKVVTKKVTKAIAKVATVPTVLTQYSPEVVDLLHKKTPKDFIDKHPFNGLDYVQIGYVRRCIDDYCKALGAKWSEECEDVGAIETLLKAKQIVVKVRLTIQFADGSFVMREQFGGSEVKCYKDTHKTKPGQPMDLGNDYKSAASDGIKKCASLLGIAQDVFEPKVEAKVKRAADLAQEALEEAELAATNADDPHAASKALAARADKSIAAVKERNGKASIYKDFTSEAPVNMAQTSQVAKLIHKSDMKVEAKKYMNEKCGCTMMTRMTVGQFNQLMNWADKNGYIPF